jgi:UDP-N-acetylglucosamine--N-acetylmuramyl-(pentapeptide) pyrophosphoryl-undecaprenol N-acetylglucosamine transferase
MNRVRVIAAAFPIARFGPKDASKVILVGNPVRHDVVLLAGSQYEKPTAEGPLRLLVFGGSQGARALSDIVPAGIGLLAPDFRSRLEVVQQCRPEDVERVRAAYRSFGVNAELQPFFKDLPARMAHAHLVISRSGAGTVSELAVIGRPAILVPLPHALDDNQAPNADILDRAGAGWRIRQSELSPEKLAEMLAAAFSAPDDLARRAVAARTVARPDAAERLADVVEDLARAA